MLALTMSYDAGTTVRVCLAYGGVAVGHQAQQIAYGCDILVATAGRLCDFIEKGRVSLRRVRFFVLDEMNGVLKGWSAKRLVSEED